MSDTNINAEYMDEQSTFTRSQAEEIFRELEEQGAQERKLQANGTDLPLEIPKALDSASSAQLRTTPSSTRKPYNNITMIRGQKQNNLIKDSSMRN
ncbi:uncharacterized protein B0P05DRAFT_556412 [Gilbertella persicaria]|uniref:uncharacterized protein n=1 Tax=Gilbertella persicaria TaxID=101096 RepID=UPI00221FD97D|nr:uncharacterized protein B0P05DRAFT_556412 [Gilbertella persicaria]KAI8062291.1 hypothetical protein B0P05DRAFT_556412 [Gilbertella persicaria]